MWAQLITMTLKDGHEGDVPKMLDGLRQAEQADSGLVRSTTMHDQSNPRKLYTLVVFESEEHARAREADQERQAKLAPFRELLGEILEGPPSFVDLVVDNDQ